MLHGPWLDGEPLRPDRLGRLTQVDGHAERRAAIDMLHRPLPGATRRPTLAADRGSNSANFVAGLRKMVSRRMSPKKSRHSAIDGQATRHRGFAKSQRQRKKIEEPFGRVETIVGMAQTMHRDLERVRTRFTMTCRPAIWRGCRNCSLPDPGSRCQERLPRHRNPSNRPLRETGTTKIEELLSALLKVLRAGMGRAFPR